MKLSDLKIIVSGGAQGMGRHFALRLVEAGAHVAIGDVNEAGLAEVAQAATTVYNRSVSSNLHMRTRADILHALDMNGAKVFAASFHRPNC